MKVLKKGRSQKGWSIEQVCTGEGNKDGGCGAKLLVEQPDFFHTLSSARDETDYYITFECPECGVLTDLKKDIRTPFKARDLPHYETWKKNREDNEPLPGFPLETLRKMPLR